MRGTGTETSPCLRDGFAVLGLAYQLIVCDVPQSSLQKTNDYTGSQQVSREKSCTSTCYHFWQWNQRHRDSMIQWKQALERKGDGKMTHLQRFNKLYHSSDFLNLWLCYLTQNSTVLHRILGYGSWLMLSSALVKGKPCSPLSPSYIRLHSPSQVAATLTCQLQGPKWYRSTCKSWIRRLLLKLAFWFVSLLQT